MTGDPKTRVLTDDMFRRLLWSMAIGYGARNEDAILRWCCRELFWSDWPDPKLWPSPDLNAAAQLQASGLGQSGFLQQQAAMGLNNRGSKR